MFRKYTAEFHLQMFGGAIVGALRRRYFPIGEITGRILSVELWCDRPRRSLDFDSLRGAPPYADGAAELPARKFRCANEVLKDTLYQYLMFS